jgi:predicted GNAT family acetyltransferase
MAGTADNDSVEVRHQPEQQRFMADVEGFEATLDYRLSQDVMTITHTKVPAAIGGRGVAAALMRAALGHAASARWTVNPVCSYAAAYMRKHRGT